MIKYTLIKSKRKTISITVDINGNIVVKAPLKASKNEVDYFLREKQDWIAKHVVIQRENAERREKFLKAHIKTLTYLGKEYPVDYNEPYGFDTKHFTFPDYTFEQLRPSIIGFYKKAAKKHISERVEYYSSIIGVTPTAVKINSAKTRWGSCSGKGSLNFSWKLILADESVLDYVVVHELCHMKQMNHGPKFWAEVEKVFPDYLKRRNDLKAVQQKITLECWE